MPNTNIKLFRISKCKFIEDLTGEGAFRVGGRWNSKGTRIIYTSQSISLSMLEVLVHTEGLPIVADMCLGTFAINHKLIKTISISELHKSWKNIPATISTKAIGDQFVRQGKYLALRVPSVLVPEEYNILINPLHKDLKKFKYLEQREIIFDGRIG